MVDVKIKADNHGDSSNFEDFKHLSENIDESLVERRPGYEDQLEGITGRMVEWSYQNFFVKLMELVQPKAPKINDFKCLDADLKSLYSKLSPWRQGTIFLVTIVWTLLTGIIAFLSLNNPLIWILTGFYLILLPSIPLATFLVVSNKPREKYMVEKISDSAEKEDVQTVGAFIGSFHAPKVKAKLESEGLETKLIPPNGKAKITFILYNFGIRVLNRIKRLFPTHLL